MKRKKSPAGYPKPIAIAITKVDQSNQSGNSYRSVFWKDCSKTYTDLLEIAVLLRRPHSYCRFAHRKMGALQA